MVHWIKVKAMIKHLVREKEKKTRTRIHEYLHTTLTHLKILNNQLLKVLRRFITNKCTIEFDINCIHPVNAYTTLLFLAKKNPTFAHRISKARSSVICI